MFLDIERSGRPSRATAVQLQVILNKYRQAVTDEYGEECPCCGINMAPTSDELHATPERVIMKTKGHCRPRVENRTRNYVRLWVWMCYQCNQDQKSFTLQNWAYKLNRDGDVRFSRVQRLIDFLKSVGAPERFY